MSALDIFRTALRGITANKLRSALTMLGVLIGVATVIVLVAIGTGSSAAVEQRIAALGTNTLTVSSFGGGRFGRGPATLGTQSRVAQLTTQDVTDIADPNLAPDVRSVSPVIETSVTGTYSDASDSSVAVYGSTPSYLTAGDDTVQSGSSITSQEVSDRSRVVLIGQTVASDLFPTGANPLGQTIVLATSSGASASFEVIGVLASKGTTGFQDPNNIVIAPYTAVQDQLTGEASTFSELLIQGTSSNTLDAAETEVQDILAQNSGTTVANLPFTILNEATLLSTAQSTTSTLTTFLGFVAGLSLLIGGIGLMNIMLVTVTERTREIGIRKAIGAPRRVIVDQFLTEATVLSVLGGAAGVVAGLIGSHFRIDNVQPVVASWSIALAFGVSIAVGVIFGLYPAAKAAWLRPIDALRYE